MYFKQEVNDDLSISMDERSPCGPLNNLRHKDLLMSRDQKVIYIYICIYIYIYPLLILLLVGSKVCDPIRAVVLTFEYENAPNLMTFGSVHPCQKFGYFFNVI